MTVAVVLVRGNTVPADAVPLLRAAAKVYVAGEVDPALGDAPMPADVAAEAGEVVVLTSSLDAVAGLVAAGSPVHATAGAGLVAAAQVMDRLRSPGGCPWDAEQTHDSLRQYLVEECFELLEAIEEGDRPALREELGDVLLQVLFHSRVAEEDSEDPFTIDDVAAELVAKLVGRHPHVFAGGDPAVRDAATQENRWEELKQQEKRRESSVDGVAMGQPALALAAKLAQRTARAGLPGDLLPKHTDVGSRLFDLAALAKLAGQDPEAELRAVARRFASQVRDAERSAKASGEPEMTHDIWRKHWPH
ncbi:XTP/dITP diphosphohydrolase [Actinokineospora alba]|uniref:XTP/dITP diphosphohydrolase n=1 Tax=Actinokineospora alba TaxID=504798 RepID=A0A1H0RZ88_9PSEU|nr:MazG family protein [Actinokineospora alba]TDP66851.1 XTP/dITP diphosphohydrolase [Actinokineospora alba]SDI48166.1 XTP/dITP diphosphohydrolase [Actinokineospora alba]SDP34697.1 XTP/dITP diphosphohydrolase [Actinokineospora alba]